MNLRGGLEFNRRRRKTERDAARGALTVLLEFAKQRKIETAVHKLKVGCLAAQRMVQLKSWN